MKIGVTGASGFIGRHVLGALDHAGAQIVAITRRRDRLRDVGSSVEVVEMDIARSPEDCYEKVGRPDVLVHLAWDGLPNYKSLHHFRTELPNQYRFLEAMISGGLPALLVTGTCFEYGQLSGPLTEDMPAQPTNPYGFAKHALHRQLEFLNAAHPYRLSWLRLFYMYGDGQPATSLYSKLRDAVARNQEVFGMSAGEQLRDYLPVSEVARSIAQLALSPVAAGTINICSGKPTSVRTLVESWLARNGWKITLGLGEYPYPDYEPMAFWGDRTKLDEILESIKTL